jgi:superfamily II DNA helicase RecQ
MDKELIIVNYINKYPNQKIIVYINSRKDCEALSIKLNKLMNKNISSAYHAGLNQKLREDIQTQFIEDDIKIIISTIAFGMGIDQIIKCVLIFGCPSSIEEYYQQIGRGGRDGTPCETVLYFDYSKLKIAEFMLKDVKKYKELYTAKKNNLNQICKLSFIKTCRRKFILEYFGESCDFFTCNNCDNCLGELVDFTDKFWPIIMNPNINLFNLINDIKNKYLVDVFELDKNNKEKVIELELFNPLWKWKDYIISNKIKKEKLSDNLKIKIPSKFIKKQENKVESLELFDDKIKYYEKLIKI